MTYVNVVNFYGKNIILRKDSIDYPRVEQLFRSVQKVICNYLVKTPL